MAQYDGTIRINTQIDTNGISRGVSSISRSASGIRRSVSGMQESFSALGNTVKKLGVTIATVFSARVIAQFGQQALEAASDLEAMESQFSQVFGDMEADASKSLTRIADQAGIAEDRMKGSFTKIAAFAKTTGMDTAGSLALSERAMVAVADSAAFYDRSLEETTEYLQSFIKGNYENDAALGLSATEFTRNAAANKLYGKSFIDLSEAQKQLTLLQMVEDANRLSGAMGQAAREADTWTNQVGNLKQAWTGLMANIGKLVLPIAIQAVKLITNVIDSLSAMIAKLSAAAGAFRSFSELLTGNKSKAGAGIGVGGDTAQDMSDGYNTAADGAENLADSTDKAAAATKKAEKAAKGYLSPLDEINKIGKEDIEIPEIKEEKDKGGTGSAGGSISAPTVDYGELAEADVETPISRLFKKMRRAFLGKDWERLGALVARQINKGLKKIYDVLDWKKVGPKITRFINAFSRTANSLVKSINWDLMGRVVGRGINLITKTFNQLTDPKTGIDFELIGRKLSTGLRGMIDEIDWDDLGRAIGNWFMTAWDVFKGFVDDMWRTSDLTGMTGWAELGKSLAEGVAGLFEEIDFGEIGTTLTKSFNGLFETLREYTLTMEREGTWSDIAKNISSGLNNMIHGINWKENGETLSRFVTDLLGTILEVAEETDWEALGRGIGEFLSGIEWDTIFGQVFDIITRVVGGLVEGFGETTAGKFLLAFGAVKTAIRGVRLVGAIKGVINKLSTLGSKVAGVGKLAANSSVNWTTFTKAIGLATAAMVGLKVGMELTEVTTSTNQDLAETGTYLSQFSAALVQLADQDRLTSEQQTALNSVISELAEKGASPVEALTTLRDALSDAGISSSDLSAAAKDAGVDLGDLVVALKDTEGGGEMAKTSLDKAGGAAESAGGSLSSLAGRAQETTSILNDLDISPAKDNIQGIQQTVDSVDFGKLARGSETAIKDMNTVWGTNKDSIHDAIKDALIDNIKFDDQLKEKYSGYAAFSVEGYNSKIKELKGEAKTTMQSFAKDGVMDPFAGKLGIHSPSTVFAGYGGNIVSGLENGIGDRWGGFSTWWDRKGLSLSDRFRDISRRFSTIGHNIVSGMKTGISERWSELSNTLVSKKDDIVNTFTNIRDDMKGIGQNIIRGLIDGLQSVWNDLTSWVDSIRDALTFNVGMPSSGGSSYTVNEPMPYMWEPALADVPIPHLAQGTVVPPNREFMAVLGDNKREPEVVSPLSTLKQANKESLLEVLSELGVSSGRNEGNVYNIRATAKGKALFELIIEEGKMQRMVTGRNPFDLC